MSEKILGIVYVVREEGNNWYDDKGRIICIKNSEGIWLAIPEFENYCIDTTILLEKEYTAESMMNRANSIIDGLMK